jgi:hypothetical protein
VRLRARQTARRVHVGGLCDDRADGVPSLTVHTPLPVERAEWAAGHGRYAVPYPHGPSSALCGYPSARSASACSAPAYGGQSSAYPAPAFGGQPLASPAPAFGGQPLASPAQAYAVLQCGVSAAAHALPAPTRARCRLAVRGIACD